MIIEILRRRNEREEAFWQSFKYEPESGAETVATALTRLNERAELKDAEGITAEPVAWEHSCLQKKCGACAMLINGRPALACSARLSEYGERIRLEALKKFPTVRDLISDRSVLYDSLKEMKLWASGKAENGSDKTETAYEASRCLQCGCCLEVCPNYYAQGKFFGMAAYVPAARVLTEFPQNAEELSAEYRAHVYEGCGKSLSCKDICPAGIEGDRLLASSNALAVWKREARGGKRRRRGEEKK